MTKHFKTLKSIVTIFFCLTVLTVPEISSAQYGWLDPGPSRYGLAGVWGKTFDPVTDIDFFQVAGMAIWNYDPIWRTWAPKSMKFKVQASAGAADTLGTRAILSVEMSGLYYLDFLSSGNLAPYLEGGLGLVYTDFQVKDPDPPYESQGSRFNFNPVIGIGLEFKRESGASYFATLRLSHISNAGLDSENRGVNSVVFLVGRLWDIRY